MAREGWQRNIHVRTVSLHNDEPLSCVVIRFFFMRVRLALLGEGVAQALAPYAAAARWRRIRRALLSKVGSSVLEEEEEDRGDRVERDAAHVSACLCVDSLASLHKLRE